MEYKFDVIIIGAGIVGLASAYQLLKTRPELRLAILEKESQIAQHQTGNNSGVIHSGIYYKPGSLKALNCKKGYVELLRFANEQDIPYELCGKVIVATEKKELPALERIFRRGQENGLLGIRKVNAPEVNDIEPHVSCIAGIFVPEAGIIDYKAVAKAYQKNIEALGGQLFFNNQLYRLDEKTDGVVALTTQGEYEARLVVNCAGLYSDHIATYTNPKHPIKVIPFRGEYYNLKKEKEHLVNNLIYPVPNPDFPFLGVHFTRMINGGIEAGPNAVLAFKREGYSRWDINLSELYETLSFSGFHIIARKYWREGMEELYRSYSKKAFTNSLQKLIPEIEIDDLTRGNAGVRAQACDKDGNLLDDFFFIENEKIIHVCNAPSPAATASLAIGETISDKIKKRL